MNLAQDGQIKFRLVGGWGGEKHACKGEDMGAAQRERLNSVEKGIHGKVPLHKPLMVPN